MNDQSYVLTQTRKSEEEEEARRFHAQCRKKYEKRETFALIFLASKGKREREGKRKSNPKTWRKKKRRNEGERSLYYVTLHMEKKKKKKERKIL